MAEKTGACISLQSSNLEWDVIDNRACELGLDRSKYTQMLYDLDLKYGILSNYQLLNSIKHPKKYNLFNLVVLLFLLVILSTLIIFIWMIL